MHKDLEQNVWLMNSDHLRQMIVTSDGTWTIALPYDPEPGTFERIPASVAGYNP